MHTANQPYNVLDGADKQKNPRPAEDLALLNRYAPVLRAYCAAGDPVCANGNNVADHLNYFELYTDEASSWVVGKIDGTADLCPAPSSSPLPSATAPASSGAPAVSAIAEGSVAAPSSSSAPAVTPAPFPPAVEYGTCVQAVEVVTVYA